MLLKMISANEWDDSLIFRISLARLLKISSFRTEFPSGVGLVADTVFVDNERPRDTLAFNGGPNDDVTENGALAFNQLGLIDEILELLFLLFPFLAGFFEFPDQLGSFLEVFGVLASE